MQTNFNRALDNYNHEPGRPDYPLRAWEEIVLWCLLPYWQIY